jgi:peptide deformylase
MLEIVQAPNPVLSTKVKAVGKIDRDILNLISQMEEALNAASDPIGVGLAAPQVGKSLAIFIAKPTEKSKIQVFINPKIIATQAEAGKKGKAGAQREHKSHKLEGCLSLKNIWGEVERAKSVTLQYTDEGGRIHHKQFTGFLATIIQHETDHLNGVLFPKRTLEQNRVLYESKKDEKGEDYFEELKI